MESDKTELLSEVAEYYSSKLAEHGETPQGVDWNGKEGQYLRFKQLNNIIDSEKPFSINDVGSGYGAFYDFLQERHSAFSYDGIDVSEDMVNAARLRYNGQSHVQFHVGSEPTRTADYGIASGIFNVRLGRTDLEWSTYLEGVLDTLDKTSRLGFAFNCLTSYSDADKMREYLYYADPCKLFDLCKRRYSRNVALLHDYDLYEFTILVRKQP
ncbi:MAG: class I SAM-dependent methyltransferase [Pseudomonas sp.]|jgi:SAM-dependent methyltransferase|uniref:class I SAM-dependent methyltransferase n=1 Tax=Pseudomonas TaxID=286 RepID=UPI001C83A73F|nr:MULTISPECIES: class I SAM-dependent methyltransferase [Pseudomonas]MDF9883692.1 SAM-dependent methyltransferase [Pseudomonas silensiensis]MDO8709898.1 class I SAM-dependent methyltransferase [Pseudomonas sp.]MDO9331161.1 class I SAM-dependent methyltransferase [Pseudomonas sp.]QZA98427.1 class I SAM-dependent methyltransferase [Pseudomonas mandelii]